MKRHVFVFSSCWKNLHVRRTFLPSWGSQDRDSSKKINSLSFSIKSMLENREPLFFTESRQYIRSAPWTRVKWLWNLYRCVKGPSCRRIKWYISDNSLLYPRCHACSIEPSLVDNLLLKMQTPVCRRQRSDVKRGTEKCAFKSCGDDIKFSKYQSAFLR